RRGTLPVPQPSPRDVFTHTLWAAKRNIQRVRTRIVDEILWQPLQALQAPQKTIDCKKKCAAPRVSCPRRSFNGALPRLLRPSPSPRGHVERLANNPCLDDDLSWIR